MAGYWLKLSLLVSGLSGKNEDVKNVATGTSKCSLKPYNCHSGEWIIAWERGTVLLKRLGEQPNTRLIQAVKGEKKATIERFFLQIPKLR